MSKVGMETLRREALIFKLLGNKRRLRLLEVLLLSQPLTLTELSRKSGLPVQEVHRTLTMMRNLGIVVRIIGKQYRLTSQGLLISGIVNEVADSLKFSDYLIQHSFEREIPLKLFLRVMLSEQISVVKSLHLMMDYFREILLGKGGAFRIMFHDLYEFLSKVLKEKISEAEGLMIETEDSPKALKNLSSLIKGQTKLKIRFRPNTLTRLVMNDEMALLFLPTINDEPDINAALLIKGDYGIKQCNGLFQWFWKTSKEMPLFIKFDENNGTIHL